MTKRKSVKYRTPKPWRSRKEYRGIMHYHIYGMASPRECAVLARQDQYRRDHNLAVKGRPRRMALRELWEARENYRAHLRRRSRQRRALLKAEAEVMR
jgi:hypothetical protein